MRKVNNCYSICYFFTATFATFQILNVLCWLLEGYLGMTDNPSLSAKPPWDYPQGGLIFSATVIATFLRAAPSMYPYIEARLFRRKGDLSKRWYVEFGGWNETLAAVEKKKIYCPAKFKTEKQREVWAKEECSKINIALRKGALMVTEKPIEKVPEVLLLINELNKTIQNLRTTLRPKSFITYSSALNKLIPFVNSINPDLQVDKFKNLDTVKFRDYLMSDLKNTPRTANNTIIHLNTIYSHLQLRSVVPESPFKIKKLIQEVTTKNISFSDSDRVILEEFLQEHEPELYFFTRFIYFAFIRPGELNNITLGDIMTKDGYIVIRGTISKNRKTETVQIIPPLLAAIKKMNIEEEKKSYFLFGKGLIPSRYESGKQVAFRRHEKVLKVLKMNDRNYTLYSWKHTGAVNAYRSGVGVKELQKLLRHSSVNITDIYLKSLGLRTDPNLKNYAW